MKEDTTEQAATPQRAMILSGGGGRGAFQCGALEKLTELGWQPQALVGTSIGSMNAAVWAVNGMEGVSRMWDQLRTRSMHRFFRLRPWRSIFDRAAWRETLEEYAPEDRLRQVTTPLYIVTTEVSTGHPVVFTNAKDLDGSKPLYRQVPAITHDHLLASSSIPYFYPRTVIAGTEYWDGAVMYNSPLRPAIDAKASEILIVLLAPYHDLLNPQAGLPSAQPGITGRIGHLLDITMTATFENDFEQMRKINRKVIQDEADPGHKEIKSALIGPANWLTPLDIIRYRQDRIEDLRQQGRKAADITWQRIQQRGWDSLLT